ncbi:hypothetical protein [Cellulophaga lytica]|uniref:hypothetical protein n=1 Tax=Cellulophaga lytica TaxID=979 RepID=UPI0004F90192|nr:hypothetical protein [Cellulophaga lytica]AIM59804.1 hypothetical protein IX49_04445 [Cellulophaga lytica]SNQ42438.1 conserved membrane hypothetical protein [Cellulophaga lytica]
MNTKKLLIISFLFSLIGSIVIFIKLSYFFWKSDLDYLIYAGIVILAIAGLLALYTCILSSIHLYNTNKFNWTWALSTMLAIFNIIIFTYYFLQKK